MPPPSAYKVSNLGRGLLENDYERELERGTSTLVAVRLNSDVASADPCSFHVCQTGIE